MKKEIYVVRRIDLTTRNVLICEVFDSLDAAYTFARECYSKEISNANYVISYHLLLESADEGIFFDANTLNKEWL